MSVTQYSIHNVPLKDVSRNSPGSRINGVWAAGEITFPGDQNILPVRGVDLYILEEITFGANIPESVFQNALKDSPLKLTVFYSNREERITEKSIDLNQFFEGLTVGAIHLPTTGTKQKDSIKYFISGSIRQTPELIAALAGEELSLSFVFTLASVSDKYLKSRSLNG